MKDEFDVFVDPQLQFTYNNFMKLLYSDIYNHIKCEFALKIDIQLGAEEKNKEKIQLYHLVLQQMLNSASKPDVMK